MKLILDPEVHSDVLEIMEYHERVADAEIATGFYFEFAAALIGSPTGLIHFLSTLTIIDD